MKQIIPQTAQQYFSRTFVHATLTVAMVMAPLSALTINEKAYAKETQKTAIEFALDALQEACAPYASAALQSLEAADLALYCLSTGETIALQAAQTPQQQQQVKKTVALWIEELQPSLALY